MTNPGRPTLPLAAIAGIEGLVLVGYSLSIAINGIREGTSGPAEVSNPPALISLVVILAVLGAGMLVVARGWWQQRGWARAPFLLAQLIIGLLGWEMSGSTDGVEHAVGLVAIAVAVIGIVLAFLPAVTRAISDEA